MSQSFIADPKRPGAQLHHGIDVRPWLAEGEVLASAVTATVSPSGGLVVDQCSGVDGFIRYRVRGGVAGKNYEVTLAFATESGAWEDEVTVRYRVR